MSIEQFQQDHDPHEKRPSAWSTLTGPVFVKRDFGFWHTATLDSYTGLGANVSLPDGEELTVDPAAIQPFRFEPDELIFIGYGKDVLGGSPHRLVAARRHGVEVEHLDLLTGDRKGVTTHLLCEVRVYRRLRAVNWQNGDRVFAHRPQGAVRRGGFVRRAPLFFPGVVHGVHESVCVEIDFDGGEADIVPTTLVQRIEVGPGDIVYACGEEWTHGTQYYPCRVLEREGENLLLQDGSGQTFAGSMVTIAVPPKGYQLVDGKLELLPGGQVETYEPEPGAGNEPLPPDQSEETGIQVTPRSESTTPGRRPWWNFWS